MKLSFSLCFRCICAVQWFQNRGNPWVAFRIPTGQRILPRPDCNDFRLSDGHAEKMKIGIDRHRGNHRQTERAFTLVEVIVAAVLVGMTSLALFGCLSSGFGIIQSARENLRATQIMLQRMENIRLFTWNQTLDTTNYLKPTFTEYYDPQGSQMGTTFQGFVTSNIPMDLAAAYRTNMRTITVTVYWTNCNSSQTIVRSRQMQTRVARSGMQNYVWGTN
jgi:type II secretory pathway pseudopilin PulG